MFKKYDVNVLVLIIIIGLIMIFVGKEGVKNKIKKDLGNYDYAIGTIEVYFHRGPVAYNATFSSITYSYVVNGTKYVNNYDALFYKLPDSPSINDKFIVAYNKNDPQKSILLGDYPVRKKEDFNVFIKEGIKINF